MRENGWTIKSYMGDFHVGPEKFHAYNDPAQMPPMDLVVVTLKSTSADSYEPLIRPLLKEDTGIVTLQNGLGNEDRLVSIFGQERIVGGLAYVCCTRIGPGVIDHLFNGKIQIAELSGEHSERVSQIAEIFNSSQVPAEILKNLWWGKWRKLVWNIPFGGLGALLDLTTDELLADERGVQLVSALMSEVIAAAAAQGHAMPPDLAQQMIPYTLGMGHYHSSMKVDRNQGRPMEIEAIFGEPLRQARKRGVETPILAMVYEMLSIIDARRAVK